MKLRNKIINISRKIKEFEESKQKFSKIFRKSRKTISIIETSNITQLINENLIEKIEKVYLDKVAICGIDGGLIARSYHGIDLIISRAVAVIFKFEKGKLVDTIYYPHSSPFPNISVISEPFSEVEVNLLAHLKRQKKEIQSAVEVIKRHPPKYLLLDGSILPHPSIRPQKNSPLEPEYTELIKVYIELFRLCRERKIRVAGIVEDTRSSRFMEIIVEKFMPLLKLEKHDMEYFNAVLKKSRDSSLLFYILALGERTFSFKYTDNPKQIPTLKDIGPFASDIYSFYLKTAFFDRPLKVEFLDIHLNCENRVTKLSNEISGVIYSLSSFHPSYGIPTVLIEADGRAKLRNEDMEIIFSYISDMVGPSSILKLRRESRPF